MALSKKVKATAVVAPVTAPAPAPVAPQPAGKAKKAAKGTPKPVAPIDATKVDWSAITNEMVSGMRTMNGDSEAAQATLAERLTDIRKTYLQKLTGICNRIPKLTSQMWEVNLQPLVLQAYAASNAKSSKQDASKLKVVMLALSNGLRPDDNVTSFHAFVTTCREWLGAKEQAHIGHKAKGGPSDEAKANAKAKAKAKEQAAKRDEALTIIANGDGKATVAMEVVKLRAQIIDTIREDWESLQSDLIRLLEQHGYEIKAE